MIDVKIGRRTVDLPFTLHLYGVTEDQFDEIVDEDIKAELLDGVMIVHSPVSLRHDDVTGFVGGLMGFYADARDLGKTWYGGNALVHLATCRRFAPDGFFVKKRRVPTPLPKQFEGAPDLALEVLSPSNRSHDLDDKRPAYRAAGVGEIWLIDLEERRVLVDRKGRRGYVEDEIDSGKVHSSVIRGFWLDTAWLWSEPLPSKVKCLRAILRSGKSR